MFCNRVQTEVTVDLFQVCAVMSRGWLGVQPDFTLADSDEPPYLVWTGTSESVFLVFIQQWYMFHDVAWKEVTVG